MLDTRVRPLLDPLLNAIASTLARAGLGANAVTAGGALVAVAAVVAIAQAQWALAFALVLGNRILDGVDGALARRTGASDFGGYLDIVADYVFYAGVPLGFALADPAANALPAAALLASFCLTASSFLAFAAIAEKRAMQSTDYGEKSFFYSTGLIEGTETVLILLLMTARPSWFAMLAWITTFLCVVTAFQRLLMARHAFDRSPP
ncbi:MAG: CDP-alcohol phosphatidyltransferase family protein [Pseudomonadota bacterium]